jgi:hypothetical protein
LTHLTFPKTATRALNKQEASRFIEAPAISNVNRLSLNDASSQSGIWAIRGLEAILTEVLDLDKFPPGSGAEKS